MNVAYNSALRQSKAIHSDLEKLSTSPPGSITPSEIGNVSASLASFSKSIDEYNNLAKQELIEKKKEEAFKRVKRFRDDLAGFRSRINELKQQREEVTHQSNRTELLGRRPYVSATPENPYANVGASSSMHARGPSASGGMQQNLTMGSGDDAREGHALREQTFFTSTNVVLDEYIARGQAVLGDLGNQRDVLKNTQRKLYSIGNTLGISGDTIRMVERRAREDKWIFWAGVVIFILFCWLCLHYLR